MTRQKIIEQFKEVATSSSWIDTWMPPEAMNGVFKTLYPSELFSDTTVTKAVGTFLPDKDFLVFVHGGNKYVLRKTSFSVVRHGRKSRNLCPIYRVQKLRHDTPPMKASYEVWQKR